MEPEERPMHCPDSRISTLLSVVESDKRSGEHDLTLLLEEYPKDARIHFLKGLLLAGEKDYPKAYASMRHAVNLAPGYHAARFQLGFVLLASGQLYAAQEAWGPLHSLSTEDYLYLFTKGLCALINDNVSEAIKFLENGILRNVENPALNREIQMIIDEVRNKVEPGLQASSMSSTEFLLQQTVR